MKATIFVFLLVLLISSTLCSKDGGCSVLKCKADEVCEREAVKCIKKSEMTEGKACRDHEDCRDDHICYGGRCILFHGRH